MSVFFMRSINYFIIKDIFFKSFFEKFAYFRRFLTDFHRFLPEFHRLNMSFQSAGLPFSNRFQLKQES